MKEAPNQKVQEKKPLLKFKNTKKNMSLERIWKKCFWHRRLLDRNLDKLMKELVSRGYRAASVSAAMERARGLSRSVALEKVPRPANQRPVFCLPYDPRLPGVAGLLRKRHKDLLERMRMPGNTFQSRLWLLTLGPRMSGT